jgi:MraZ protein
VKKVSKWNKKEENGTLGNFKMFLGTFEVTLIDRNRLSMPAKIQEEIAGPRLVLVIGFEECIFGFREKDWEEVVKPELSRPFFSDDAGREMRRKMCASAKVIDLGSQRRFVMPQDMVEFAGIVREKVTIIGAGDHFEIWDSQKWYEYQKKLRKSA